MDDMEKVVCHLNDCIEASRRDNTWVFVRKDIVEDALALLKEQEPVKPVNVRWEMGINGGNCPKCMNWVQRTYNYCPFCGKAVKWE